MTIEPCCGALGFEVLAWFLCMQEQRERLLKEKIEQMRADNPKITEQFADVKRALAEVGVRSSSISQRFGLRGGYKGEGRGGR
jgi:hypothetical protein